MARVVRFVDEEGMIQERFLDLVHVRDTLSTNLKTSLWKQLLHYQFDVSKIRGQGYDGASNMRGKWNGLQALVLEECPYAYYVHCFAHRLQLALVCASREVIPVHQFFTYLVDIVNVVCASSKRHDELQKAKASEVEKLLELGEINSGKGQNQLGTLRRAGDTRWGSHYNSVCSLIKMFDATRVVLAGIIDDVAHTTFAQRGDADGAWRNMQSFEFVFILHLIEKVMGKTEILSQALQSKSQDILNAMELVSATKITLNNYRNDGWDSLIKEVTLFCNKHIIEVPDMKAPFTSTRYRARKNDLQFTFEHYYRVDLFISTLDKQIHELNSRFTIELLSLSSSLVSKVINVDQICLLVEKFYPEDFTDQEITGLRRQLELFNVELSKNIRLSSVSTLSDLCKTLVKTNKREEYALVDRVVRLILTLPVSTATTERGFSAMKIFKNRLRNKMADEYLTNSLVIYIEKEIDNKFDSEDIIDEFKNLKGRRAEL
ncbi:zinc finger MYM-type protein 1-like [Helianthus annuus]|uniref:zinc finger MYM-type protein 1-like n=1 Tax=Helianthus annuus TaxID=4232 RepID=UPI001653049B|nr:zinc finger MYM-type protein 1-like [Helianthus annuus]